jgi:hypothetical protein
MTVTGPDFIALQARNVQAAAAGLAIQATKNLSALPIAPCAGRGGTPRRRAAAPAARRISDTPGLG